MTVKYVHDFIIKNTEYAFDNYHTGNVDGEVTGIVGVFFRHKALCGGISLAAKWLLDRAGIPSGVIEGLVAGDGVDINTIPPDVEINHAWNIVCVNDVWQYMDVTMDMGSSPKGMMTAYDYFLRKDSVMDKYARFKKPPVKCPEEPYCYFAGNHCYLTSASQVEAYVRACWKKGKKRIYFEVHGEAAKLSDSEIAGIARSIILSGYQYRVNHKFGIYDIVLI